MTSWSEVIKEAASLFAILDPIGSIAIFLSLTIGQSPAQKKRTAFVAIGSVFLILLVSIILGEKLLLLFGISIASFQVGGGILIFLLAISMLKAEMPEIKRTKEEAKEAKEMHTVAVVPLAIPLLAGPGAISTVIIQSHNASTAIEQVILAAITLFVCLLTLASFLMAVPIERHLGKTGMNVITRLMGLVLSAIAVEIIAKGLKGLFPALG